MEAYKLYLVGTAKIKPGKFVEATKWWQEKGIPNILSRPYTKSLRCYASQFGLGGEYDIEIWQEIENYAAMDVMDAHEEHLHPRVHFTEARKLREIGEVAYMRGAMKDALEWIGSNPGEFLRLTGLRVLHIWFGPLHNPKAAVWTSALTLLAFLGLVLAWKKLLIPQRAILLIPLVTFPLIYYIVAYMPRYRVPIDWIFFMLAGSAIWHWIGKGSKESERVQNQRLQP